MRFRWAKRENHPRPKVILHFKPEPFSGTKKIIIIWSILFLSLAAALFWVGSRFHRRSLSVSSHQASLREPPAEAEARSSFREQPINIQAGKTITELLGPYFASPQIIQKLLTAVSPVYNLSRIKAGHSLVVKTQDNGEFQSLVYEIDPGHLLRVEREADNFTASIETIPYETRLGYLAGEIEGSLVETFNNLGEGDQLALALAEIFSWEIDFYIDLRPGDTFALIFEKKFRQQQFAAYGDILAAQIINRGRKFAAFRFRSPSTGKIDYFDAEGNSLRKEFLRSPLKYGRITSRFSFNRLHPIRKIYRPHYGVDYAAPIGTPVQATADGLVTFVGWNGGSGRMVRIRHNHGYETLYLHLREFSPGINPGARVEAGQVIGYVGSSGESTGPHLDYRILYRGRYINPLAWRFEPAKPLPAEQQAIFKAEIKPSQLLLSSPLLVVQQLIF